MQDEYINYPQTPWYEERQNWLFIGAGVLLVAVVVIGSVLFVRHRSAVRSAAVEHERVVQETQEVLNVDLDECKDVEDSVSCNEDKVRMAAAEARSVEICDKLDGEAYGKCVADVAVASLDGAVCDKLENAAYCKDRALFATAKDAHDYSLCDKIEDLELRESCQGQLVTYALADTDCRDTHLTDEECLVIEISRDAMETSDLLMCDRLADLEQARDCKEEIESSDKDDDDLSYLQEIEIGTDPNKLDSDGDGLDDGAELKSSTDPLKADSDSDDLTDGEELLLYGSDPTKQDTDGDGYKDGEEVKNGYSPVGEGRL